MNATAKTITPRLWGVTLVPADHKTHYGSDGRQTLYAIRAPASRADGHLVLEDGAVVGFVMRWPGGGRGGAWGFQKLRAPTWPIDHEILRSKAEPALLDSWIHSSAHTRAACLAARGMIVK